MKMKKEFDSTEFDWEEFEKPKLITNPYEIVPALPTKDFPIVVRAASRDEIDDIPRDLYTVTVLATVKRPGLEEALVIALTRIDECQDSFKSLLLNIHDIVRKSGGGDEPPGNLFFAPIDEGKLADCIIGVMRGFFHDEETCNICDKEYNRMEFCVLMHIFFKHINILKNPNRLPFSMYLQNQVLVGKEKFGERTFNKYADKKHFKLLKDELKGEVFEVNFQVHPVPPKVPDGKFLRLAFLEIGYAFQHSGYFTELKELRDTMKSFKLLDDPPEKALAEKNLNAHGEKP